MNITADRLLTFAEASKLLGISLRQFRRLVDSGRLAVVRLTERTPRVRMTDLQALVVASTSHGSTVRRV